MKYLKTISGILSLLLTISILTDGALGEKVSKPEEKPVSGGTYRRPLEFSPNTLDPALHIDLYADTVNQQLFDGLVQFDKDLNVIPAIAKSWKISLDGLTYTFYLREGVNFHNGREVTADDFIYSFTRIIDPKNKSPGAHLLEKVLGFNELQDGKSTYAEGLRSLGKYIFEIKLSRPFSPFISALGACFCKVVPREEIEKSGSVFAGMPVGTGPFKFVSMKEGGRDSS